MVVASVGALLALIAAVLAHGEAFAAPAVIPWAQVSGGVSRDSRLTAHARVYILLQSFVNC